VKFDANGERIWGSYYWVALVTYLLILQKKFTYQEKHLLIKNIHPNAHQINIDNPNLSPIYGYFSEGFIAKIQMEIENGNLLWRTR
jgi:hypothetical protein